jgi:polyisoprenoid-binding protein YceI
MVLLRSFIPTLGMLLLAAGQAGAQGVLIDRSEIRFLSKQMGANVEGRFRKWKANIAFLPKDPGASKAEFEIDLASVDLASDEAEAEIKGPLWFDTAHYPLAKFVSMAIRGVGADKYEVAGALSIKGITRDIVVPVAVKKDAMGNSVAQGEFVFKRLDFKVGEGQWANTATVGDEVVVRFRMVLPPVK